MRIVRIPKRLEGFFAPLRGVFKYDKTFQNFRAVVLAMALMVERRTITRMVHVIAFGPHRSRLNELVTGSTWDAPSALQQIAKFKIARLQLKPGDRVRIIVDDTSKPKRGKRMPGVGKYFDHVLHAYRWGHTYVVCLIEVNGQIIPWGIALYLKKEWCQQHGQAFKKLTELAAELIQSVARAEVIPEGVEVVVLFDSYYLCRTVVQAIPTGWFFVSRLKSNRNLTVAGQKRKAGRYAKNLLRRRRQRIRVKNGSGRTVSYLVAGNTVRVSKLGPVSLVASRRGKEKKVVALVTNHPQLTDRDIVVEHGHRWVIEVFFKEAKQHLGLGEYQTRSLDGAVKHLHLSLIAFALLTHAALKGRRDPANKNKDVLSPLRVEKLQAHLRGMIGRDLIRYIADRRKKPETQIQEIQSLLLAA